MNYLKLVNPENMNKDVYKYFWLYIEMYINFY